MSLKRNKKQHVIEGGIFLLNKNIWFLTCIYSYKFIYIVLSLLVEKKYKKPQVMLFLDLIKWCDFSIDF